MDIKNVMFFSGKTAAKIIKIFKYQESDIADKKGLISMQKRMIHWNTAYKLEVKTKGYQVIRLPGQENHCTLKLVTKSKPSFWSLPVNKNLISKSFAALRKSIISSSGALQSEIKSGKFILLQPRVFIWWCLKVCNAYL